MQKKMRAKKIPYSAAAPLDSRYCAGPAYRAVAAAGQRRASVALRRSPRCPVASVGVNGRLAAARVRAPRRLLGGAARVPPPAQLVSFICFPPRQKEELDY
jgi:hypothetical protein